MKMNEYIRTSGNGNPSNFHVICGVGLPVALPKHDVYEKKHQRTTGNADRQRSKPNPKRKIITAKINF